MTERKTTPTAQQRPVALITGSSRGIGAAIALTLAKTRYDLIVNATRDFPETLVDQLTRAGARVHVAIGNIADEAAASALAAEAIAAFGRLDVLVNNAGITRDTLTIRMTSAQFTEVIQTNLVGTFNVTQPIFRHMLKRRTGQIVNLGSVVGATGNVGQANYAASKAGIIGLTKTLAQEGARRGIRVNAVAPGMIETAMTAALSDEVQQAVLGQIPLGRFGAPAEVANAVLFCLTNPYLTGQVITLDGGLTM